MFDPVDTSDDQFPQDTNQEEQLHDKWFAPYRRPLSDNAKDLVADVTNQVQNYEHHFNLRRRRRRSHDQQVFEDTIASVVCDLAYNYLLEPTRRVAITRSNNILGAKSRYRPNTYSKRLPNILDCLGSELGFVDQDLGTSQYEGGARRTTIQAGPCLISRIENTPLMLSDFTTSSRHETIILKRTKEDYWDEGGLQEYADNAATRHFRDEIAAINQALREADIDIDEACGRKLAQVDPQERSLRRIFTNGRFNSGGRLFGGFWQGLGKRQRLQGLFINEEHVVELDYAQMAPRIVYGMAGADLPDGDLYGLSNLDFGHDVIRGQYRKGVKKLFNAMLYATAPLTKKPRGTAEVLPKNHGITKLMEMIMAAHPAIKDCFFQGLGHDAQFVESQIMVAVLLELKERGIVALPVHDALIVAWGDADLAKHVMLDTFSQYAGVPSEVTRMEG